MVKSEPVNMMVLVLVRGRIWVVKSEPVNMLVLVLVRGRIWGGEV